MDREREHERYQEWIDLAADGVLGDAERRGLEAHLAACADCRREQERSHALVARLGSARIEVRPGFAREVLEALEPASWEARTPRSWRLPVALLAAVGGASAVLFGVGAAELDPASGSAGALFSIVDLLRAAFVAGGGVAAASWRGLGGAVGEWLGDSAANWGAAAMLVLGANYLLYRLLRLRSRAARAAEAERRP